MGRNKRASKASNLFRRSSQSTGSDRCELVPQSEALQCKEKCGLLHLPSSPSLEQACVLARCALPSQAAAAALALRVMEGDELYGDLDASVALPTGAVTLSALQREVEALREENANLRRNISSVYRTAKKELARKDAEIKSLRQQQDQQRPGKLQRR